MVSIARERMELLMEQADHAALEGKMDMADRYVDMARRIGMRYNVRFSPEHRRRFCRACYRYLLPGSTSRTRMSRGRVVTTCLRCGHIMRRPLGARGASGATGASGG
jgi:ribonuclease P protein subunit RPR2